MSVLAMGAAACGYQVHVHCAHMSLSAPPLSTVAAYAWASSISSWHGYSPSRAHEVRALHRVCCWSLFRQCMYWAEGDACWSLSQGLYRPPFSPPHALNSQSTPASSCLPGCPGASLTRNCRVHTHLCLAITGHYRLPRPAVKKASQGALLFRACCLEVWGLIDTWICRDVKDMMSCMNAHCGPSVPEPGVVLLHIDDSSGLRYGAFGLIRGCCLVHLHHITLLPPESAMARYKP